MDARAALIEADRRADRAEALETYCFDLLAALIRQRHQTSQWRAFADQQLRQRLEAERTTRQVYAQIAEMRTGMRHS